MAYTPSFESPTILKSLKEFFQGRDIPAFLVGGYLRDTLLGIPTRDIDLALPEDPLRVGREMADALGGAFFAMGHAHQMARVVGSSPDMETWSVDLAGIDSTLHEDLSRRDFTLDAMALGVEGWCSSSWKDVLRDPLGGRDDLARGIIRAVKPAVFREDPLRLLRAVRLAAKLGFRLEPSTEQLMVEEAHLVSSVPGERLRDEFLTMLSLDGAKLHLETLDGLGFLCCIIPELEMAKGVQQPKEHYWDVFHHSVNAVEGVERVLSGDAGDPVSRLVPWDQAMEDRFGQEVSDGHTRGTLLKLAALLHDVGKPQTKTVEAGGRTRFFGHQTLGASMSVQILERLRLSSRGIEMVRAMVESHLRPTQMSQNGELPTPRAVYRYFRDMGDAAIDTLYLNLADHLAARGPQLDMAAWERHTAVASHILETGTTQVAPEVMPRLITGHDLIRTLGLSPGPRIGALLEGVREAQSAGEVQDGEEALAWARRTLRMSAAEDREPGRRGA